MQIVPKTEEQVALAGLIEKGIYQFEIRKSQEKISKSGNPMFELMLTVWDKEGREHAIYDYLLESIEYKLRHLYYSIGLGSVYETGQLNAEELIGKCGLCKIFIKEDKTGQYAPKNAIADYMLEDKTNDMKPLPEVKDDFQDDTIPF